MSAWWSFASRPRRAGSGDRRGGLEQHRARDRTRPACKRAGADAVLVVAPYYNKPSQEGMLAHFKAINDAVDIPIVVYNMPARTVVDISVETMGRHRGVGERGRRQGRHRRHDPGGAPSGAVRRQIRAALRRRSQRARLQRPWRRRLHFSDGQCRAEAVRANAGGEPRAAISPPRARSTQSWRRCTRRCSSSPRRRRRNTLARCWANARDEVRLPLLACTRAPPRRKCARRWRKRGSSKHGQETRARSAS